MILTFTDSQDFYNIVNSSRKIGAIAITEAECARAFHTINGINKLNDRQNIFEGDSLEYFEILDKAKALILPGRITYSGEDFEKDMRSDVYANYTPEAYGFNNDVQYMTSREFKNFWYGVAGSRKKDAKFATIDKTMKGNMKLADVEKREMLGAYSAGGQDARMAVLDASYIVPIKLNIQIREDFKFNIPVSRMFGYWTEAMLDSLGQ